MDVLYTLRRKHISSNKSFNEFDCLHCGNSLCCISVKNLVAFTTRTELDDTTGKSYGSHVYVADLNTPWHSYKVTSKNDTVLALEWDATGERLLVATETGDVSLWSSREHILNSWSCIGSAIFPGELIISAAFFHNGRKISIVAEKKDSVIYSEKMSHIKFSPSVRAFGGGAGEGCLILTGTGMVGAAALSKETPCSGRLITAAESLASTRATISTADISYGKNGQFVVAVSNGESRVQCYTVSVKLTSDNLSISSQAQPSFFLQSFKNNGPGGKVTGLKFVTCEDADSLVVSANTDQGGVVEVWQLTERPIPLHRVFQPPPDPIKTVAWQFESSYITSSPITCVTTCKVALTTSVPPPSYVMVATSDATLHCLYRDSLKVVATRLISSAWQEDTIKHQRLSTKITYMDLTWLGCALALVDSHGQLYIFKVPPILEPGVGMTVNVASTLLEYCLVTGTDNWDVLVSIQTPIVDAIVDKIVDNYSRQVPAVQQYYYASHLALRMALARLTVNGQTRASDLNALLMLHTVSAAFTSLLRPSDSSHDKGPTEILGALLADNLIDVDKILMNLDGKDFTVEPSTLQSLQQLIQWTADLALNILARIPEQYKVPTSELGRDLKAINQLRQLLVIVRIWGLLRSTCLPVFVRSAENLDVLALLFKLLSKLVQNHEPDETLIDDCCLLPSQVMIPQINSTTPIVCIVSPSLAYQGFPIQMEYGIEPDCLVFEPEQNNLEGCLATDQSLDTLRHVYLGKQPYKVKQCCRCGGKAQLPCSTRNSALRAWDLRWLRSCRCGGTWREQRNS